MKSYRYTSKSPYYEKYKDFYINFSVASRILNTGQDYRPNISTPFWTKTNLINELLTLVGAEKGLFKREDSTFVAAIPNAQREIDNIERDFEHYCKTKVLQGHEKPTEYPSNMLTAKLKAEAHYDVKLAERDWLERKLAEIGDKEDVKEETEILKYGPVSSSNMHGIGTDYYDERRAKAEIDGQLIHLCPQTEEHDAFLIIWDSRSPYSGMKISAYYKLSAQFKIARMENEQLRFRELQKKCRAEGKEVPMQRLYKSASVVDKKNLPAWPNYAKHYDENGDVIEEQIIRKRTK